MEIVMLVCLLGAGEVCEERATPAFRHVASERACLAYAPPVIARWAERHPKWRVRRWRCRVAGAEREI